MEITGICIIFTLLCIVLFFWGLHIGKETIFHRNMSDYRRSAKLMNDNWENLLNKHTIEHQNEIKSLNSIVEWYISEKKRLEFKIGESGDFGWSKIRDFCYPKVPSDVLVIIRVPVSKKEYKLYISVFWEKSQYFKTTCEKEIPSSSISHWKYLPIFSDWGD